MKREFPRYRKFFLYIGLLLVLVVSSCSGKKRESSLIAQIGDRRISAGEFTFAYELAPRQLTSLEKSAARRAVLDQLITVILMAQEAEQLGLDETDTVMQRAVDQYRRMAVNRELYLKYIRNPIDVDETEEHEAFRRSKIRLYIRHFESDRQEEVQRVSNGDFPFEHIPVFPGIETVDMEGFGEVDVVGWNSVHADVEDILYGLPLFQISDPWFDGWKYHLFQVVEREREVLLRENEFQARRESIHGILKKRKEAKAASRFVQDVMEPQDLIIKADALNQLTDCIWDNRPASSDPRVELISNEEIKFVTASAAVLGRLPIAVFRNGEMTISDILFRYKVNPQEVSYDNKLALRESLKNAVAVYVRDWVLSEKGIKEKLDRKPSVLEEQQTQREQLLARKMMNRLYREISDASADSLTGETFDDYIDQYVRGLREEANIHIFEDNLMAVNTSDEGLARKVDFIAFRTQ